MRGALAGLVAALLPLSPVAAQETNLRDNPTNRILDHCDPATVDDAIACYDRAYTDSDKAIIRDEQPVMAQYVFDIALKAGWLKNDKTRLAKSMRALGFTTTDDMANAVIDAYQAHLRGQPFDLAAAARASAAH